MCAFRALGGLQAFLLVALFVAASALGLLAHLFKHQLSHVTVTPIQSFQSCQLETEIPKKLL